MMKLVSKSARLIFVGTGRQVFGSYVESEGHIGPRRGLSDRRRWWRIRSDSAKSDMVPIRLRFMTSSLGFLAVEPKLNLPLKPSAASLEVR